MNFKLLFASHPARMAWKTCLFLLLAAALSSCASLPGFGGKPKLSPSKEAAEKYAAFRSQEKWRSKTYRNTEVLNQVDKTTKVVISLKDQRGILIINGMVAMDFPVASGRKDHPTPTGDFKVLDKQKDYGSNLYGKIYDATGVVVVPGADSRKDAVPEGGYFEGAKMPFWMRLTSGGVGLHVGYVPGHPASHGCVRMPDRIGPVMYEKVKVGTPVEIVELYDPAAKPVKKKGNFHWPWISH